MFLPQWNPENGIRIDRLRVDVLDAEGEAEDGGDRDLDDEESAEEKQNSVERTFEAGKLVVRDLRVQRHLALLAGVHGHRPNLRKMQVMLQKANR